MHQQDLVGVRVKSQEPFRPNNTHGRKCNYHWNNIRISDRIPNGHRLPRYVPTSRVLKNPRLCVSVLTGFGKLHVKSYPADLKARQGAKLGIICISSLIRLAYCCLQSARHANGSIHFVLCTDSSLIRTLTASSCASVLR